MNDVLIMTPGPTAIHEDVRNALARRITNPDLDLKFFEFYKDTTVKFQKLLNTENEVLILSGEGILGLEAACASLIEPGDRVLVIDNGIFGNGFGDFAKIYGAEVVYFKSDYQKTIDVEKLEEFLEKENNFKVATLVHCETPSGITNKIDKLCPLLNSYGIISVVDAVASMGGEELLVDEWKIDIALGGSQKCLSSAPGLTIMSISEKAWKTILNRKVPIAGFYVNLANWKTWYQDKWFPYTQSINDIYGLKVAVEKLLAEKDPVERHKRIADATRKALIDAGIELYPIDSFSNAVTTINLPPNLEFEIVFNKMVEEHKIMIAGAFGHLEGKVIRIGHMGENCYEEKVYLTLKALDKVFRDLDIELKSELHKNFVNSI